MQKKFFIINLLLFIISIPVFLQLSQIVTMVGDSYNIIVIGVYIVIVLTAIVFMAVLLKKIESQKTKEIIKIIYKDKEKTKDKQEIKKESSISKTINEILEDTQTIKNANKFTEQILKNLAKVFNIVQGVTFLLDTKSNTFKTVSTYAFYSEEMREFEVGEGLTGQVAKNKEFLCIENVPKNYITVLSGLGEGTPKYLILFPIIYDDKTIGIIEFATFDKLPKNSKKIFEKLKIAIGKNLKKDNQ